MKNSIFCEEPWNSEENSGGRDFKNPTINVRILSEIKRMLEVKIQMLNRILININSFFTRGPNSLSFLCNFICSSPVFVFQHSLIGS